MLEAEPLPRAAEAGLDLVDDEQCAPLPTEPLRARQKIALPQIDAALALHDFQNDGGGCVGDGCVQFLQIVVGDVLYLQQRHEWFAIFGLPRHRECADRTAMEAAHGGNDARTARGQAGELERAVHRFRTAIGKKDVIQMGGQNVAERRAKLGTDVVIEEVGAGDERVRLPRDGIGQHRMAVAQHGHTLGRGQVQITLPRRIPQPAPFAPDHDRLPPPGRCPTESGFFACGKGLCCARIHGYLLLEESAIGGDSHWVKKLLSTRWPNPVTVTADRLHLIRSACPHPPGPRSRAGRYARRRR